MTQPQFKNPFPKPYVNDGRISILKRMPEPGACKEAIYPEISANIQLPERSLLSVQQIR